MSDLTDPNEPDIQEAIHDLLLANYVQNRRMTDLLYCLVDHANPKVAEALLEKHNKNEFFYPDVFEVNDDDTTRTD